MSESVITILSFVIAIAALGITLLVSHTASKIRYEEEERDEAAIKIIVEKMENFLFRVDQLQTNSGPPDFEIKLLKSSFKILKQNITYFSSLLKADHIGEVNKIISMLLIVDEIFGNASLYYHFKEKKITELQLRPMRYFIKKYKIN